MSKCEEQPSGPLFQPHVQLLNTPPCMWLLWIQLNLLIDCWKKGPSFLVPLVLNGGPAKEEKCKCLLSYMSTYTTRHKSSSFDTTFLWYMTVDRSFIVCKMRMKIYILFLSKIDQRKRMWVFRKTLYRLLTS